MTNNNNIQGNFFDSIFGVVDDQAEKKKAQEQLIADERAAKAAVQQAEHEKKVEEIRAKVKGGNPESSGKVANNVPAKPEEPVFAVNEDTVIRWWHMKDGKPVNELPITDYFTVEELAEGLLVKKKEGETERKPLDAEMLRKRMEKDFPELVKSFTQMIFMDKANIVHPTIQSKKKGCSEKVLSSDSTFPLHTKIPFSILRDFIAVAKLYAEFDKEVHADIYCNPNTNEIFLDFPKQLVHAYWVEVTEDAYSIRNRIKDAFKVMEIHSHHSMRAMPSAQDNESERFPGMHYAIVGTTQNFFPSVFVRQFMPENEGYWIEKKVEDIFENPFYETPAFDTNLIEVSNS